MMSASKFKFTDDYLVIDIETTIRNVGNDAIGKNKASAFHPENRIVVTGALNKRLNYHHSYVYDELSHIILENTDNEIPKLWVGQNIKFDMHHIFKSVVDFQYEVFPRIQIWDTQLAEYLLTGQEHQYASLNALSKKYGGTQKNDVIKDMWDAGMQTEDIDSELLLPYLQDDVMNTHLVFNKQLQEADRIGMLPLILTQMDALKCTIEMEYNGMHFNRNMAINIADEIDTDLTVLQTVLEKSIKFLGLPISFDFNPNSVKQVSLVLFGGDIKVPSKEDVLDKLGAVVRYKTGKRKGEIKTRMILKTINIKGFEIPILEKWKSDKGNVSVSDNVLNDILSDTPGKDAETFISAILEYRKLSKQRNTYFVGYSNLTWPTDSCIHQGLNHTATATGRLSSSKPNLQNVTNKGD